MNVVFRWIKPALSFVIRWFVVLMFVVSVCGGGSVLAQTRSQAAPSAEQEHNKTREQQQEETAQDAIDWGAWGEWQQKDSLDNVSENNHTSDSQTSPPSSGLTQYGVGVQGAIENQLSELDKSNLLDNAGGVAVKQKQNRLDQTPPKPTKDIKRMMQALQQMEAEVEQEINDDSEF